MRGDILICQAMRLCGDAVDAPQPPSPIHFHWKPLNRFDGRNEIRHRRHIIRPIGADEQNYVSAWRAGCKNISIDTPDKQFTLRFWNRALIYDDMAILVPKVVLTIAFLLFIGLTLRLLSVIPPRRPVVKQRKRGASAHVLIVLGSGGHTAEMLAILRNSLTGRPDAAGEQTIKALDWSRFAHRTWVVSSGDSFSATRAKEFEDEACSLTSKSDGHGQANTQSYTILTVPRARKIHQPLITAPFSSLQCLWACVQLLLSHKQGFPDLILINGPATATIMVWASVLLRFFGVRDANDAGKMRTIYVESWARVKKLSLSGRLLCWVADRVLVQWPQLDGVQGKGEFLGVLV